jgi:hypothetical protein
MTEASRSPIEMKREFIELIRAAAASEETDMHLVICSADK